MMAADTLEALGIPRGQYVIKVNNRKILDGVMEAIGIGGPEQARTRLTVLRAFDKADKFPISEIAKLLQGGRLDESGDFTKGAGLSDEQLVLLERARRFFTRDWEKAFSIRIYKKYLARVLGITEVPADISNGLEELETIRKFVRAAGYGPDRIRIDPSVVRGLEYYTGPVFEAELLFEVKDEEGRPVRFGSVGGGGRYDGLVSRFLDEKVPATGFSIGVSRLLAALQALGKVSTAPETGPVVVLAMDRTPEAMAAYQKLVADLRSAGIRAELYLGAAGMKAQMKYADRRNSPVAIIHGSNEREAGSVQVKDLILGATLSGTKDREEYLARQAEAQFEVPVSGLVEAVRKVLARHGL